MVDLRKALLPIFASIIPALCDKKMHSLSPRKANPFQKIHPSFAKPQIPIPPLIGFFYVHRHDVPTARSKLIR